MESQSPRPKVDLHVDSEKIALWVQHSSSVVIAALTYRQDVHFISGNPFLIATYDFLLAKATVLHGLAAFKFLSH